MDSPRKTRLLRQCPTGAWFNAGLQALADTVQVAVQNGHPPCIDYEEAGELSPRLGQRFGAPIRKVVRWT